MRLLNNSQRHKRFYCARFAFTKKPVLDDRLHVVSGHRVRTTPLKPLKPTALPAGRGSHFAVSPVVVRLDRRESTLYLRQKGATKKG